MNKALTSDWPKHGFAFKGGGPSAKDAPPPIPPVTERATEVEAASGQARKDALKRKGSRMTLLARETGGYNAEDSATKKTLLGS